MPSKFRAPTGFVHALALTLAVSLPAVALAKDGKDGKDKKAAAAKEISADDKLDKQMDWENKVLGPNTIKKIDLAKIQKLQAEEMARREKQEKVDQAEKDRKEREAAAAAEKQRNVKQAGTHEMPEIQETPPAPAKPVEKHDDAFVDKVLSGKTEKKKTGATNDEVDQLLSKAKTDKPPAAKGGKGGKGDGVDALLATADKQANIKTKTKAAEPVETVSAEAAAREATIKAIAAAQAKAQEERNRNRRPVVPDAAMLRAQASAAKAPPPEEPAPSKRSSKATGWTDPFASDGPSTSSSKSRGKVTAAAATVPASSRTPAAAGRHSPSTRSGGSDWQDPFDSGGTGSTKPRPAPKAAPAARPGKRPANWKDPFA